MGDLAGWASAVAAAAAAYAAFKSLEVSRETSKQAADARHAAALRDWRHTNVSVIVEGGSCLSDIARLVPSMDSVAALSGGFGSSHEQLRKFLSDLEASIRSLVEQATDLRARAVQMQGASVRDIETALTKAYEQLASVRMASGQCAKLQANADAERTRLLDERKARAQP